MKIPATKYPVERFTLDNGLRVVLTPDRSAPVVGVAVVYDVGIRSEPEGSTGFAHLFEHMLFSGSEHVGNNEHFRYVQSVGGVLNGTTFTGLSRSASDKLTKAGFRQGVVTNDTTNQTRSATAVFYADGQRNAALDVAKIVGIPRDAVQRLDSNTRGVAGEDAARGARGPGSFHVNLYDALAALDPQTLDDRAKISG